MLFGAVGSLKRALRTTAQPLAIVVRAGRIRLTDVSHHYGNGRGGLDGVTLDIAAGEKVGLVGRSGAGKSTPVNLVLRFFDAEAGRIEIDGQDITAVTQESLRRQIAMVTQEAALLHRSVRDNIAYGGATDGARPPPATPLRTASLPRYATRTAGAAMTPGSASGVYGCPAGSGNGSHWLARCTRTRRSWCWARPPRRSTRRSRRPSTRRSTA